MVAMTHTLPVYKTKGLTLLKPLVDWVDWVYLVDLRLAEGQGVLLFVSYTGYVCQLFSRFCGKLHQFFLILFFRKSSLARHASVTR